MYKNEIKKGINLAKILGNCPEFLEKFGEILN